MPSRPTRGRHRGERGESLVEFAFATVIFFTVVFGIVEFGIAIWNSNMVSVLAQEGARFAAVRGSSAPGTCSGPNYLPPCRASWADVQAYLQTRSYGMNVTVDTSLTAPGSVAPGGVVTVKVDYNLTAGGGLIPAWSFPISTSARMTVSR